MRSPFRTLLLGLNVLSLTLLVTVGTPVAITPTSAAPVPFVPSTDYAASPVLVKHVQQEDGVSKRSNSSGSVVDSIRPRDINTVLGDINILNNYYTGMTTHAANFRKISLVQTH